MKFKVLSTFDNVKAKARELNLQPCPIDEKNLSADIFEEIFYEGQFVYHPRSKKEMTGYIRTTPVWLIYRDNAIIIHPLTGICPLSEDNVTGRFSELFNINDHDATDEQDNEHYLLCYHDKNYFYIHSYWAEIK